MRISEAEANEDGYRCWRCVPRTLDPEVPLPEQDTLASHGTAAQTAGLLACLAWILACLMMYNKYTVACTC